ncbi:MAG: hydrogenase maturation nickel metallochaperone HypA [Anaerolineae bacterium]|jgi:hydrogenase nickel incorporation protein HypA/HybF|nr:hydrogenase maturation nickel metallochaperone HypA [Anaerolineae bacterium]
MHELGVTQQLLKIALQYANEAEAVRINQLTIVIGELSSIVDDSVQFYWDIVSKGSIAQGSTLCFKRLSASLHCDACGHEFPLNRLEYICPECGSDRVSVASGDEFFLESIDVDLEPESTEQA